MPDPQAYSQPLDPAILAAIGAVPNEGAMPAPQYQLPPEILSAIGATPPASADAISGGQPTPGPMPAPSPSPMTQLPQAMPGKPETADEQMRRAEAEEKGAAKEQLGAIGQESEAAKAAAGVEAQKGEDIYRTKLAENERIYGRVNPDTGEREGGLVQEQHDLQALHAKQLASRISDYDKATADEAKVKIDPNRRWNEMSTGRKIGGIMMILLSGIGNALSRQPGAPNLALQMLDKETEQDLLAQRANAEQAQRKTGLARDSIGMYREMAKDQDSAWQLRLAEEYKRMADDIDVESAKYASPIAQAEGQKASAFFREKAAGVVAAVGQRDTQVAMHRQTQDLQAKMHRESIGVQYAQMNQAERHFEATQDFEKKKWDDETNQKAAQLALAGRKEEAAELKTKGALVSERGVFAPTGRLITQPDGTTVAEQLPLKQQDGSDYIAPEKSSVKAHEQYAGGVKLIDALDNLRKLRHENSGNITSWSPDARAKAMELERALVGAHQAAGIAGFRGNVMEVMDKVLTGGADPTSVLQSVMPTLDRARDDAVQDLDITLRHEHNYTGRRLEFPDPLKQPAPPETAEKKLHREIENAPVVVNVTEASRLRRTLDQLYLNATGSPDPKVRQDAATQLEYAAEHGGNAFIKEGATARIAVMAKGGRWRPEQGLRPEGATPETAATPQAPAGSPFSLPVQRTFPGK